MFSGFLVTQLLQAPNLELGLVLRRLSHLLLTHDAPTKTHSIMLFGMIGTLMNVAAKSPLAVSHADMIDHIDHLQQWLDKYNTLICSTTHDGTARGVSDTRMSMSWLCHLFHVTKWMVDTSMLLLSSPLMTASSQPPSLRSVLSSASAWSTICTGIKQLVQHTIVLLSPSSSSPLASNANQPELLDGRSPISVMLFDIVNHLVLSVFNSDLGSGGDDADDTWLEFLYTMVRSLGFGVVGEHGVSSEKKIKDKNKKKKRSKSTYEEKGGAGRGKDGNDDVDSKSDKESNAARIQQEMILLFCRNIRNPWCRLLLIYKYCQRDVLYRPCRGFPAHLRHWKVAPTSSPCLFDSLIFPREHTTITTAMATTPAPLIITNTPQPASVGTTVAGAVATCGSGESMLAYDAKAAIIQRPTLDASPRQKEEQKNSACIIVAKPASIAGQVVKLDAGSVCEVERTLAHLYALSLDMVDHYIKVSIFANVCMFKKKIHSFI